MLFTTDVAIAIRRFKTLAAYSGRPLNFVLAARRAAAARCCGIATNMPLIVVSGLPSSGKSSAAAALADVCRALGQDVVVVDEDSLHLRRNDSYKGGVAVGPPPPPPPLLPPLVPARPVLGLAFRLPSPVHSADTAQIRPPRRWRAGRCCRQWSAA